MDRIDAMKVFIAAVDEGSFLGASRRLARSPAAISRAIASLEAHIGVALLHRTTRSLKLSQAGERYAAACRKVMIDLNDAELAAASEGYTPCGTLSLAAPTIIGEDILRPILVAIMDLYPDIRVNLVLTDHRVNMIDEGVDVALRFGRLADSSFIGFPLGEVRKVIVASPRYLATRPQIRELADLPREHIIALTDFGPGSWDFPAVGGLIASRVVNFSPRLVVNTARAAVASAIDGHGVARLFSYQAEAHIRNGTLQQLFASEDDLAIPVHLVTPKNRLLLPKVRVLIDFLAPRLKAYFSRIQSEFEHYACTSSSAAATGNMTAKPGSRQAWSMAERSQIPFHADARVTAGQSIPVTVNHG